MTYFSRACMALWAIVLLLSNCDPARACLNDAEEGGGRGRRSHFSENRTRLEEEAEMRALLNPLPFDRSRYDKQINSYHQVLTQQPAVAMQPAQRNSYALALIYTGIPERARDIWIEMEAQQPGTYATAANLGTAYELCGDNENALKWISEGLKRNPDSHLGTEWLHARILQGKLALDSDPGWLSSNHVSGLKVRMSDGLPVEFGSRASDNLGDPVDLQAMREALSYQLRERLKFLRQPDPMMAQLLLDFGDVELLSGSAHTARIVYQRAQEYGMDHGSLAPRLEAARIAMLPPPRFDWLWIGAGGILAVIMLFLLLMRRRRQPASA